MANQERVTASETADIARGLAEMTGEQLATMSAKEVLDALGGMGQMLVTKDGFYTKEFAEAVKAQPQFPLMVATPDNYKGTEPFTISMQVNGMNVTVEAERITLVPQVFYEVWMNRVQGEANLRQMRRNAAARMQYSHINQVPFFQG